MQFAIFLILSATSALLAMLCYTNDDISRNAYNPETGRFRSYETVYFMVVWPHGTGHVCHVAVLNRKAKSQPFLLYKQA